MDVTFFFVLAEDFSQLSVCVCVCICMWVGVCVYMYVGGCVCICMWVGVCVYMYVGGCVCVAYMYVGGGWCRSESVSEPTTPLTFTQQPRWTASQEIQTQQLQPFDTVITENQ